MTTKSEYWRNPEKYRAAARAYAARHRKPRPTLEDRLWAKVDQSGECWLWTGSLGGGGRYGAIRVGGRSGRMVLVHRLTYEWARGSIPDGLELDHLCRTTRCVRPEHLEPVTHRENVRRGSWGERASRCPRHGVKDTAAYGYVCRPCRREANRAYRRRHGLVRAA